MTWGMVSITTVLALFSQEILLVWARNPQVAEKTSILLAVWAIGMGLNTLAMIPYYLQLAYGRSNISFRFNLIALILNIPALIIASNFYGAVGAAFCWLILNAVYLVTFIPAIQRNFLSFSLKDWYLKDVGKIAVVGVFVGLIFRRFITPDISHIYLFILIGLCFAAIAGLTFFVTELPKFTLKYDLFYKLKRKFL
jgi:O-antigen/teichoic acid export membrane protein